MKANKKFDYDIEKLRASILAGDQAAVFRILNQGKKAAAGQKKKMKKRQSLPDLTQSEDPLPASRPGDDQMSIIGSKGPLSVTS